MQALDAHLENIRISTKQTFSKLNIAVFKTCSTNRGTSMTSLAVIRHFIPTPNPGFAAALQRTVGWFILALAGPSYWHGVGVWFIALCAQASVQRSGARRAGYQKEKTGGRHARKSR